MTLRYQKEDTEEQAPRTTLIESEGDVGTSQSVHITLPDLRLTRGLLFKNKIPSHYLAEAILSIKNAITPHLGKSERITLLFDEKYGWDEDSIDILIVVANSLTLAQEQLKKPMAINPSIGWKFTKNGNIFSKALNKLFNFGAGFSTLEEKEVLKCSEFFLISPELLAMYRERTPRLVVRLAKLATYGLMLSMLISLGELILPVLFFTAFVTFVIILKPTNDESKNKTIDNLQTELAAQNFWSRFAHSVRHLKILHNSVPWSGISSEETAENHETNNALRSITIQPANAFLHAFTLYLTFYKQFPNAMPSVTPDETAAVHLANNAHGIIPRIMDARAMSNEDCDTIRTRAITTQYAKLCAFAKARGLVSPTADQWQDPITNTARQVQNFYSEISEIKSIIPTQTDSEASRESTSSFTYSYSKL